MPLTRHAGKRIPRDRDSRPLTPEEIARGEEVLSRVGDFLADFFRGHEPGDRLSHDQRADGLGLISDLDDLLNHPRTDPETS